MPSHNDNFAIVIPAYNEAKTIRDIAKRSLLKCQFVIIVDDGSSDETSLQLKNLNVKIIRHKINLGKAATLLSGIQYALDKNVDFVITLDGDGQHFPEDIDLLLEKRKKHPDDIIIGARLSNKKKIPSKRFYANKIANFWIAWAAGYPIYDSQSGFRLYPRKVFQNLKINTAIEDSFVFESEILIKSAQKNIKSHAVNVNTAYPKGGRQSHFRGVRDITLITLMVAKSLFSRFLYLPGLYYSVIKPKLLKKENGRFDYDGYFVLLLTFIVLFLTSGLAIIIAYFYVLKVAVKSKQITKKNMPVNNMTIMLLGKRLINNTVDSDFLSRLKCAHSIYKNNQNISIYILGGKTNDNDISEAQMGKSFLIKQGVSSKQIILEESSLHTLENFKKFSGLINSQNKKSYMITNRYHMARALLLAKGFGLKVLPCPAEKLFSCRFYVFLKMIIESFYIVYYLVGKYWAKLTKNKALLARIS